MTTAQWQRLAYVFHGAIERRGDVRAAWLETACAGDLALRRQIDVLLDAHETAGDFLEEPATFTLDDEDAAVAVAHTGGSEPPDGAATMRPGTCVGPYAIVEEIGRGGMGIVYLAEDRRLGRLVALKAVPPAVAGRRDLRERLRREARALATIAHPAVAIVHALEEFGDDLFMVSEYVRGHTLRHEIDAGPLVPARALSIARDITGALEAAHAAGVIHRDLKPENVLIGDQDVVKVVDFGVASIENVSGTRLTRADMRPGTPAYMAPEQLLGAEVDARADLYAFGVLLLEMLTGRHPMNGPWRDDDLPAGIAAIIDRCLQPAPHARYRSATQLRHALEGASAALPGSTRHPGAPRRGGPAPRWWWEFHQAVVALVYWLMVIPAWGARSLIGGLEGRLFFLLTLAAVIVSANLRFHLWFTARFYPIELAWVRARSGRWIRAGDWVFALALTAGGLLVDDRWSAISVLLVAVGLGAAVAFLLIEPVTARAAFPGATDESRREGPG